MLPPNAVPVEDTRLSSLELGHSMHPASEDRALKTSCLSLSQCSTTSCIPSTQLPHAHKINPHTRARTHTHTYTHVGRANCEHHVCARITFNTEMRMRMHTPAGAEAGATTAARCVVDSFFIHDSRQESVRCLCACWFDLAASMRDKRHDAAISSSSSKSNSLISCF